MQPNQYDTSGACLKAGDRAERDFVYIAVKKGWTVSKSTPHQDMDEHWDYKLTKTNQTLRVEVKAMKKLSRDETEPQDVWTWLELHGVKDDGWIYGGKADVIAFERKMSFFIVSRKRLMGIIPDVIDLNSKVNYSKEAKYKIYQRHGRIDKLSLVEFEKLEPIKNTEWKK